MDRVLGGTGLQDVSNRAVTPLVAWQLLHISRRDASQQAAVDAARPGATLGDVDAAARDVIADAGFGDQFIHRTGHGIGTEVHEQPYVKAGNDEHVVAGHAFSIEPGIYFPERWGMRLEDIVVIIDDGAIRCSTTDHDLVSVSA